MVGLLVGLTVGAWELLVHPAGVTGSDVQMLVRVEDPPRRRVPGEVVFLGREVLGKEGRLIRCRAVDLPWRGLSPVEQGDLVWVRGSVLPISRPFNPFSWDAWLWRRGVSGEMKVLFGSKAVAKVPSRLLVVRQWIMSAVQAATRESRGGALFLSMAFGVRDILSPPVENLFERFGLTHLLVVSGYQVSLVFSVVLAALLSVGRSFRSSLTIRGWAIGLSLVVAAVYVLAIGTEMSSVRALIAAVCLCLSLVIHRRHGFAQRILVTFMSMNLVWPWALFEIGVVLTFAALAGIGIGSVVGAGNRWRSLVWVTISVWALTSAVTVIWNGSLSPIGLLLNLVLATPWSVLNCTVGVGGLALLLTGLPDVDLPIRAVGYINEAVVTALFWLNGFIGSSRELSLSERYVTAVVLILTASSITRVALRAQRGIALRAMVQGGAPLGGGCNTAPAEGMR